ncbi:RagB/SusD family nutrient uptake outer membrane protein [Parabacteroides timonensis]|uniref:RagB/SusD family nutrient uptake outer membrane protein n=1 Tax=Parabacteroides timonensis TaxID=1871013 RepID=UPI00094EDDB2|nr:RagB/SusD family nutrient uptake outer membrane protein [Parabacteroides timonensis]
MKTYYKIIVLLLTILLVSCDSQLDQLNPNRATEATFWQTEEDFKLALTSCYTPLKNALNGGYYGTRGVMLRIARADEVEFRNDISEVYTVHRFTNSNTNGLVQGMFYQLYNALYRTNSIMQELEKKNFSTEFNNEVKGEALFIRGYYLFVLGKEFKDVPLRLTASQDPATFPLAKSSQKDVYDQAIKDLTEAASLLPMTNIPGKPTKGSAYGFLGKIYLYMEDWQLAKNMLEPLTKSPYSYKLMEDFSWNFDEEHENNAESLFELLIEDLGGDDIWGDGENVNSTQSNTRPIEYAAAEVGGWFEANPTQQMMDIFLKEKDKDGKVDYRARMSVAWNYEGCTYYMKPFQTVFKEKLDTYWILKYQNWQTQEIESNMLKSFINERALRYADILLMLAEAELELGNTAEAVGYINQIRARANLNPYSGELIKGAVKEDLIHQRAIEFFVEGERFYDLRRWGLLDKYIQSQDPGRYTNLSPKFYYFPIPAKELQTNELCTPSEGW